MTSKPVIRITIKQLTPAQKRKAAVDRRRFQFELGRLVQTWAVLSESLAGIFQQATECQVHISNSVWHSVRSDLAQREMLLAALKASCDLLRGWPDDEKKKNKLLVFGEYIWAVQEITTFSHRRNDLVHSPIVFLRTGTETEYETKVESFHGNPRAQKLKDKELYQYCRWLTDFCENMNKHISFIWQHVHAHGTLPERPKWRSLSLFPTRRQPPHRKRQPQRRPRPRS
jgi:hypothetical protein